MKKLKKESQNISEKVPIRTSWPRWCATTTTIKKTKSQNSGYFRKGGNKDKLVPFNNNNSHPSFFPHRALFGVAGIRSDHNRGCSHITSAKIRDSWTPPPPSSAMVSFWLTSPLPADAICEQLHRETFLDFFFYIWQSNNTNMNILFKYDNQTMPIWI